MMKQAVLAAVCSMGFAAAAQADTLIIDLTGWNTWQGYHNPGGGSNSGVIEANLGVGTVVTGIDFSNLTVETMNNSWGSEWVFSLNAWDGSTLGAYWDVKIPGWGNAPGIFGPYTGPGQLYIGTSPLVMDRPDLWITVYETFNDGGNAVQDSTVLGGTVTITYTPIPAPGALALLGLAGVVGVRRRRA